MEVRILSEPSVAQAMLWDNRGIRAVPVVAEERGVAFALTACQNLAERLRAASGLANLDVIVLDGQRESVANKKPDIIFFDTRLTGLLSDPEAGLKEAHVAENVPVLPINLSSCDTSCYGSLSTQSNATEIFLKARAALRRKRPVSLRGQRKMGPFVLDETRFKLIFDGRTADLSKVDLCLLGPFFDVNEAVIDRKSLEILALEANGRKVGSRMLDVQISRMRRYVAAQLGVDPLRSVRGIGYACSKF